MHRFYLENANFEKNVIVISDKHELHHMKNVLRLTVGDGFVVFNGNNEEAQVVISKLNEHDIEVTVKNVTKMDRVMGIKIILACAVPKKAKFEFIIEKCTELGVSEIIPLRTQRSDVIYSKEKLGSKQERFKKVAINAAKQSKRTDIPMIHEMTDLKDVLLKRDRNTLAIFPCLTDTQQHIHEILKKKQDQRNVYIFIGPEGDFTPQEVQMAKEQGCTPVSLGATVLKVDTAAIAAVAFVALLSD